MTSTDRNVFDRSITIRTDGKKVHYRINDGSWDSNPSIPSVEGNSTFPVNWCLGLLTSAKTGRMRSKEYLQNCLWSNNRSCFYAVRDRDGRLISYWGIEDNRKLPFALQIVFGKDGLPISYALIKCSVSTSKDSIAKGKFEKVEEGSVTWKKFANIEKQGQSISLPVRVVVQSVLNDWEELECVNEITWLFGKDVPDSAFVDPKVGTIIEPNFDPK